MAGKSNIDVVNYLDGNNVEAVFHDRAQAG
jgi:hypothetical protein